MDIFEQLKRPFPASRVHWRVGRKSNQRAMVLAYIDARDVMQRLDDVMGPGEWQAEYLPPTNGIVICRMGLNINGEWIWKANGAGETQVEGEKGSCSDAFKRAAVLWGIGRYLYSLPNEWVDLDQRGNFTPPKLPAWATPEGFDEIMAKRKAA